MHHDETMHTHEHTHADGQTHSHEHTHPHDHEHSHEHGHHHHAAPEDMDRILDHLAVPEAVRENAKAVYRRIADAEAAAHGVPVTEVHFHEVGALDAVAAVTGVRPTTGLPLQLYSMGGTSVAIVMGAVGLILNISSETSVA